MLNSNVLLTNSYVYKYDNKQCKAKQPYPPLGTLYAASVLRKNDYKFHFIDHCLANDWTDLAQVMRSGEFPILIIWEDGFNYLTKMCLTIMREKAYAMIELAKGYNMKVIISSSDATDHFHDYHQQGVDFVIHGEGEQTLIGLLAEINNG